MSKEPQNKTTVLLEQLEQCEAAGDKPACIAICKELLERIDRNQLPELWAYIQGILGDNFRTNLGDPSNGPEQAIDHYQLALEVLTEEEHSVQWAANNGNLGNIFMDRAKGDRKDNLKQAIAHFRAALRVFDREPKSLNWAATHASLGEALAALGKHPDEVIQHYESALSVLSKTTKPSTWLKANIVLGETYSKKGPEGMDKAVSYLQEAIAAFPAEHHFQYGYLNEKLGHCSRGSTTDGTEQGQELMIRSFETALEAYQAGEIVDGVTRVQAQLGECYAHRIRGDRATNIRKAIEYLEAVLEKSNAADPGWAYLNAALAHLYEDPVLQ